MHFLTARSPFLFSSHLTPSLFPPLFFCSGSTGTVRPFVVLNDPGSVLGSLKKGLCCSGGFFRRCKDWEGEFSSLESEILEFMQNSKKPQAFPTKEELVASGREDLVHAIANEGGWLAFGWDLNGGSGEIDANETQDSGVASSSSSSSQPAKSLDIEAEESGIEGILNRLEKQRNSLFGLGFREKEDSVSFENNEDKDEWEHRTTTDAVAADLDTSSRGNSIKPEWRNWVIRRNGFSDADFEDAEIVPVETQKDISDVSGQPDILNGREFSREPTNRETKVYSLEGNANHSDIKSRIQHLESELSSVLHSLRSSTDIVTMQTGQVSSSDDLAKLSDAWEFQENEIMNAQDRLRSIRAKLAVLEGKMALAIMDAHKVVEEKQKKINSAQKALKVLRTISVVWPNTASEVLLAGSFDGWSTKRRMVKLSTGIFSVSLQLYPGKYEIKFIVDGEWKTDPLRPLVSSNGYENNLLIILD